MVKLERGLVKIVTDQKKAQVKIMLKNVLPMLIFDLTVTCILAVVYLKYSS